MNAVSTEQPFLNAGNSDGRCEMNSFSSTTANRIALRRSLPSRFTDLYLQVKAESGTRQQILGSSTINRWLAWT